MVWSFILLIAVSRLGLFMFDLVVTQIVQMVWLCPLSDKSRHPSRKNHAGDQTNQLSLGKVLGAKDAPGQP